MASDGLPWPQNSHMAPQPHGLRWVSGAISGYGWPSGTMHGSGKKQRTKGMISSEVKNHVLIHYFKLEKPKKGCQDFGDILVIFQPNKLQEFCDLSSKYCQNIASISLVFRYHSKYHQCVLNGYIDRTFLMSYLNSYNHDPKWTKSAFGDFRRAQDHGNVSR